MQTDRLNGVELIRTCTHKFKATETEFEHDEFVNHELTRSRSIPSPFAEDTIKTELNPGQLVTPWTATDTSNHRLRRAATSSGEAECSKSCCFNVSSKESKYGSLRASSLSWWTSSGLLELITSTGSSLDVEQATSFISFTESGFTELSPHSDSECEGAAERDSGL